MTSAKYIDVDVHTQSISIAVGNSVGKVVMECVIESKASTILQFIDGIRGDVRVAFEEGTWAAWLYHLRKPHVIEVLVCNTRKNVQDGSKSDRIDARKLSEMLRSLRTLIRQPASRVEEVLCVLPESVLFGVHCQPPSSH